MSYQIGERQVAGTLLIAAAIGLFGLSACDTIRDQCVIAGAIHVEGEGFDSFGLAGAVDMCSEGEARAQAETSHQDVDEDTEQSSQSETFPWM